MKDKLKNPFVWITGWAVLCSLYIIFGKQDYATGCICLILNTIMFIMALTDN